MNEKEFIKKVRKAHFELNPIGAIKFRIYLFFRNIVWRLFKKDI